MIVVIQNIWQGKEISNFKAINNAYLVITNV